MIIIRKGKECNFDFNENKDEKMIVLRKYIKDFECVNGKKKIKNVEVKQRMRRGYKRLQNIQSMVQILEQEQEIDADGDGKIDIVAKKLKQEPVDDALSIQDCEFQNEINPCVLRDQCKTKEQDE